MNPSGNTTILVKSPVDTNKQAALANRLLAAESVYAEQVGFLTVPDTGAAYTIDLRMMGGEFCGNATRSAAVYCAFAGLLPPNEDGSFTPMVKCSGNDRPLTCTVKKTDTENTFQAEAQMPIPLEIKSGTLSFSKDKIPYVAVIFQGITHYIIACEDLPINSNGAPVPLQTVYAAIQDKLAEQALPAYGIMFYDERQKTVVPVVYVKETNSTFWEQSCASGSLAIAVATAHRYYGDRALQDGEGGKLIDSSLTLTLAHPDGSLEVRITATDTGCRYFLSGLIHITTAGEAYL